MDLHVLAHFFRKQAEKLTLPAKEANIVAALFNAHLMPVEDPLTQTFDPNHPVAQRISQIVSEINPTGTVSIYVQVDPSLMARVVVKEKSPQHKAVESALEKEFGPRINAAISAAKLVPPEGTLIMPWISF